MDQKYFDEVVKDMEKVACNFRGWSLTKEQYEKVEELWEMARLCYLPTYMDNNPECADAANWFVPSENIQDLLSIGDNGLTMDFGGNKYVLSTAWDLSTATLVEPVRDFVEDADCYFHFFQSGEAIQWPDFPIKWEGDVSKEEQYDDAMKVVK